MVVPSSEVTDPVMPTLVAVLAVLAVLPALTVLTVRIDFSLREVAGTPADPVPACRFVLTVVPRACHEPVHDGSPAIVAVATLWPGPFAELGARSSAPAAVSQHTAGAYNEVHSRRPRPSVTAFGTDEVSTAWTEWSEWSE